jgi:alkylation response protein AidB-like acyl-CoA dehydrogenase
MDKVQELRTTSDRYVPTDDDYLSEDERKQLTPQLIKERLYALKPFIATHALETEKKRRPVDAVWKAIRKTGFFYLVQAKRYGGLEATFDEMMDCVLPICEADPATGWLAAFSVMNPRSAAGYPLHAQDQIFAGNRYMVMLSVLQPIGKAVKVEGGYRVSGRWAWATTVQVADWASVVAELETPEGPKVNSFLMPAADLTILDTWNAHGLIATGTHHVMADNVFVPEDRMTHAHVGDPSWHDNVKKHYDYEQYLGPISPSLSLTVAIPVVGAARGAIEAARSRIMHHVKRGMVVQEKEKLTAQVRIAHAEAVVRAAELLIRDAAKDIYATVGKTADEQFPVFHRSRARLAQSSQLCREAMMILVQTDGTSMHYFESPLGRAFRDIFVGGSHMTVDFDTCMEAHGRLLLGLQPKARMSIEDREKARDEIAATSGDPFGIYGLVKK